MFKSFFFALSIVVAAASMSAAQEIEVDRYNITARADVVANALDARAALSLSNLSQTPKPKLYLRLTKLAKVTAVTVNGASATFETAEDRRVTTLNQIIITPPASIAPGAKAVVELSYRVEVPESTALAAIYPGEVLMMPEAVWVPMPSTMFTMYGATTAPFTLSVTLPAAAGGSFRAASSGAVKSDAGNQTFTFEQPLNSLPFIVASNFDQPFTSDHGGVKIEIYVQHGLSGATGDAKQADAGSNSSPPRAVAATSLNRLGEEAGRIIDFFTKTLGPPPSGATFRIISSARTGNVAVPGAVVFNEQVFRRDALDAGTIEVLADAIARMWVDGRVRVRGQEARSAQVDQPAQKAHSTALIRDSLPRYLAALYFEDRFGKVAGREFFTRKRWSYTPIAQAGRDAELEIHTIILPTYGAAAFSKGPLVLRLLAETGGRDKLIAALREILSGPQTKIVTIENLRQALAKSAGPEVDNLFQQWVYSIIEPDIIIGIPQPADTPGMQRVNLRNLGTGDVKVTVLAVTASGKQLTASVVVPSEDIKSVDIQTSEKITSVEADPEKLLIQTSYDNDAKPVKVSEQTLFNESIIAFNKGAHAEAETKLREAVRSDPQNSILHAWLARVLAAQNKYDEAVNEANAAIKIEPPTEPALAWAHITLGQVALARNQAALAVEHLRRAMLVAEELPAQFAAREALVRAERAANMLAPVDESIRTFVTQLDSLIKQPSSEKLFTHVIRANLRRFVQGLTVTPPSAWTTEILRVDSIDANRASVDVNLKVTAGGRDQSATALFILLRTGSRWVLEDIQHFNVK